MPTYHQIRKAKMRSLGVNATFCPETVDWQACTVEVIFTTGQGGLRAGFWDDPYIEKLQLDAKSVRAERLKKGL